MTVPPANRTCGGGMRVPTVNRTALAAAIPANMKNMAGPPTMPMIAPPSVGPTKLPTVEKEYAPK
ncbi:hypothetical protein D3C80_1981160 [compost metagenome]